MKEDDFEKLVRRLEVDATISPRAFRTKVALISVAAYLVLFGLMAALATYLYLCWTFFQGHAWALIKLGAIGLAVAIPLYIVVLRVLFMRFKPPTGRAITREEAPRLFETLDKLRAKLKGPKIDHVLIDRDFNAAIVQHPRFGLAGGHTNYLILGLPFLLGMAPNEMLAVIAHEYGHLCGNHSKFSAFIYRQRHTLGALHAQVTGTSDPEWSDRILARLLGWYAPIHNAYTFVLSRQNEYEADRAAIEVAGPAAHAGGLVRSQLLGRWVGERYWSRIYEEAERTMRPAFMPYASMRTAFKACHDEWCTSERLAEEWERKAGLVDTHPSLRERVDAADIAPELPSVPSVTGADAFLGANATAALIAEFDQDWWKEERPSWEERCKYVTRSKARLMELNAVPLTSVPLMDLQEFAYLTWEFDGAKAAKPILEHLMRQPGGPFPRASYAYGRILLDEGARRGLDYLEEAARKDRTLAEACVRFGCEYLMEKEGQDAAQEWFERFAATATA